MIGEGSGRDGERPGQALHPARLGTPERRKNKRDLRPITWYSVKVPEGEKAGCAYRAGALRCRVLGDAKPRGICGSGLVDAVAAALDLGLIRADGRLVRGERLHLALAADPDFESAYLAALAFPG